MKVLADLNLAVCYGIAIGGDCKTDHQTAPSATPYGIKFDNLPLLYSPL